MLRSHRHRHRHLAHLPGTMYELTVHVSADMERGRARMHLPGWSARSEIERQMYDALKTIGSNSSVRGTPILVSELSAGYCATNTDHTITARVWLEGCFGEEGARSTDAKRIARNVREDIALCMYAPKVGQITMGMVDEAEGHDRVPKSA